MRDVDFVTFECVHIADADQNDVNEKHAIAYADIDGYPATDDQGSVICRVWLLKERSNGHAAKFLVDWHYNGYRENESVMEVIKQAKEDLGKYRADMRENLFQKAYERYKLEWMVEHKHTLGELIAVLEELMKDGADNIGEAFETFESYAGFANECWACREEFRDSEWKDATHMRKLLDLKEYNIWLSVKD